MDAWIWITIAAAFAQTLRFMAQKRLTHAGLSTAGATFARFAYSAPLVAVAVAIYASATDQALPHPPPAFWPYALSGALAQILATACVVSLFRHRNFAVGIAFKKTEVILTALLGLLVLGDRLSLAQAGALALGLLGVLCLSDPPRGLDASWRRFLNRAAALGLASGGFFAISAVGYRGAVLTLETGDTALRAGLTLALVTAVQVLAMAAWMTRFEPGQIARVARAWRLAGLVGLLSMLGSYGWFVAFSLQNAALVFAVGQVELIFSLAASILFFGERITRREGAGLVILTLSILGIVLLSQRAGG